MGGYFLVIMVLQEKSSRKFFISGINNGLALPNVVYRAERVNRFLTHVLYCLQDN